LDCFVQQADGSWLCMRDSTIGSGAAIRVRRGQRFDRGTVFAGHDDFAAYLESVSVEKPDDAPDEWR
jgi:hypothetical protein